MSIEEAFTLEGHQVNALFSSKSREKLKEQKSLGKLGKI
jgi:hypothetical protein